MCRPAEARAAEAVTTVTTVSSPHIPYGANQGTHLAYDFPLYTYPEYATT